MPTTALPQTLFDKLRPRHLVEQTDADEALLYVDRHLVYEVTSPQAFEGLRLAGRKLSVRHRLDQRRQQANHSQLRLEHRLNVAQTIRS